MSIWLRLLFLLVFTVGCCGIAVGSIGGGHGTLVFVPALLLSPLILASFVLLSWFLFKPIRIAFVVLMAIYYFLTISTTYLVQSGDEMGVPRRMFEWNPIVFSLCVLWYLVGHLIIWTAFVKQRQLCDNSIP